MFYKILKENEIVMIGESSVIPSGTIEITEEKYNALMATVASHPADTLETKYYLSNETEQYIGRARTHVEKVEWYANTVLSGQMTIEEVPEDYRAEVEAKLPTPEPDKYTLDEAAAIIASEVAKNE